MFDHSFADAIRDLTMAWSNRAHGSQVVWAAGTGHEVKEHADQPLKTGDRVRVRVGDETRFGTVERVDPISRTCEVAVECDWDNGKTADYFDAVAFELLSPVSAEEWASRRKP